MKSLLLLLVTLVCFPATSGILINGTRIVYSEASKAGSISIENPEATRAYLIQSWVDRGDNSHTRDFIITPPLIRMDAGDKTELKIVRVAELPKDRESLFWLNVRAIPSTKKSNTNSLQIAVKSRMKLFYRPLGMPTSAIESYKKLVAHYSNGSIVVKNPTPFHVVFYSFAVDGRDIKSADVIKPFSAVNFDINKSTSPKTVSWRLIDDFGSVTGLQKQNL